MNVRFEIPTRLTWMAALLAGGGFLASVAASEIPSRVAVPAIGQTVVSITDFGGVGDGRTLNSAAFEKALDSLAAKGGGTLVVPPGIWLTGPIHLRSRTELHVERGALIQFSGDFRLYPLRVTDLKGEKEVISTSPIFAENEEDVAITGEGIIDGGGDAWRMVKKGKLTESDWKALVRSGGVLNEAGDVWWPSHEAMDGGRIVSALRRTGSLDLEDYEPAHQFLRPKMVRLIGIKRLLIRDVTFRNPPNWTVNPVFCEDVSIQNMRVFNSHAAQNSDALDLESCRRAVIRGCTFDVGDDGICLKSGKDEAGRRVGIPTEDVRVEDCVVYGAHGGFTIGSEMSGGVRNVRVNNCLFIGTDIGLRFKTTRGRGGVVENIFISNVRMADIPGNAINFNMYYGGKAPLDEDGEVVPGNKPAVTEGTPQFRNIRIENVVCRGADKAIVLQGLPEMPIRDLVLKDVSVTSRQGVFVTDAEGIRFENVRVEHQVGPLLNQVRVKDSELNLK